MTIVLFLVVTMLGTTEAAAQSAIDPLTVALTVRGLDVFQIRSCL